MKTFRKQRKGGFLMTFDLDKYCKKSSYVQFVQEGNLAVIWHSLFGHPKIVSVETLNFIESFSIPKTICSQFNDELMDEDRETIKELLNCYFLVPEDFNDRLFLEERMREREKEIISGLLIDYLELIMSEACNFRC
ncbi:MAG: hypothetical protein ACPL3E_02565, partial [Minisyncoccia bacterium]